MEYEPGISTIAVMHTLTSQKSDVLGPMSKFQFRSYLKTFILQCLPGFGSGKKQDSNLSLSQERNPDEPGKTRTKVLQLKFFSEAFCETKSVPSDFPWVSLT